jgi:predicted acylesterase/phospholipase RssA
VGKVVKLEEKPRGKRQRGETTALVLGGGGFTGGVYHVGALRALNLLTVDRTVNDFDVYVGTSAGAFVCSLLANGITPEQMMQTLNQDPEAELEDPDLGTLMQLNYGAFLKGLAGLPLRVAGLARQMVAHPRETSMIDLAMGLSQGLPAGIYNSRKLRRFLAEILSEGGRTNDFRKLEGCKLLLAATDVDTVERVVIGHGGWADVPISEAVAASAALPVVYEPVEIKGRQLMDGGIRSTTNVDIAVAQGAKFIVVINPIVPYVNDFEKKIPTMIGKRVRRVAEMGMGAVGNQAFRLLAHQRLHLSVDFWRDKYPGVDIILIEPNLDDALMFGTPIMDYGARLEIAKHGFQSVTMRLAEQYSRYKQVAARHGIEISAERVNEALATIESEPVKQSAWRRVLSQTTGAVRRSATGR